MIRRGSFAPFYLRQTILGSILGMSKDASIFYRPLAEATVTQEQYAYNL